MSKSSSRDTPKGQPSTRDKLIAAGVRNLKEFGYPEVNADNILTDQIYRAFFKSMLEDNLGKGQDVTIAALLNDIEDANHD